MNRNQVKGRVRVAKGTATKLAGKLLRKPKLVAKGRLQEVAGTVQAAWGDARSVAGRKATAAKRTLRSNGRTVGKGVASATRQAAGGARKAGKHIASRAK